MGLFGAGVLEGVYDLDGILFVGTSLLLIVLMYAICLSAYRLWPNTKTINLDQFYILRSVPNRFKNKPNQRAPESQSGRSNLSSPEIE